MVTKIKTQLGSAQKSLPAPGISYIAENSIKDIEAGSLGQAKALDLGLSSQVNNRQVDNVKAGRNYDAVIDSHGRGDFMSIASAIKAGRKRLFVRNGTYYITEDIAVEADTIITGEGSAATILNIDYNSGIFSVQGTAAPVYNISNVIFENLFFSGNSGGDDGTAIYTDRSFDITIRECVFTNFQYAVEIGVNASRINIENCKFTNNKSDIQSDEKVTGLNIINNYFQSSTTYDSTCIDLEATDQSIISLNKFNIGSGAATAIYIGKNSVQSYYNLISDNIIYGSEDSEEAIYISHLKYSKIVNNNIFNIGFDGLILANSTFDVISGNSFFDVGIAADDTYCGIDVRSTCNYMIFCNNNISVGIVANRIAYGINDNAGNNYNIVMGNVVNGAQTDAITVPGAASIEQHNIET